MELHAIRRLVGPGDHLVIGQHDGVVEAGPVTDLADDLPVLGRRTLDGAADLLPEPDGV